MLLSFLKKQNEFVSKDSYLQCANQVIKGASETVGAVADDELFKELNSKKTIEQINRFMEKYLDSFFSNGQKVRFQLADSAFKDALGEVGKGLGLLASGVDDITYYLEFTNNFETYKKYEGFFNDIIQASDDEIPRELQIAATLLQQDFENKEEQAITSIGKQIGSSQAGDIINLKKLSEIFPISDAMNVIGLGAIISNLLIDAGGMVENISYTEAYVYLTNFYTQKLEECKQEFLQHKTEENAWKFYDTYNLLHQLREAEEESYLNIYDMKGLCGELVKLCVGFPEKEVVVRSNLDLIRNSFRFATDIEVPERDDKLYENKIIVACPVDVEIYNTRGEKIYTIYDGAEADDKNNNGRFVSLYRPSTDDYVKIAYLNQEGPFKVNLIGKDTGKVSMLLSGKENNRNRIYKFQNLDIDKGNQIFVKDCGTATPSYEIKDEGGQDLIQGDLVEMGDEEIAVTGVNLSDEEKLCVGETRILNVFVSPENASCQDLMWSSDRPEIVSVKNGVVTGKAKGTATITVRTLDGGFKSTCKLTVIEDASYPETNPQPSKPIVKTSQTITAKSFTKTYGNKAFSLGAKAKTKLTYKSNNTKVATVNSAGKVTLKGPGKATITITAAATANYNGATKHVTITVKPKKVVLKKAKAKKERRLQVRWGRDTRATGYQVVIARNKKFKKGKKTALIRKNKTTSKTFKKLKRKKNYYYKVRAYKKVGKTKIYGAYSKVKIVKVR